MIVGAGVDIRPPRVGGTGIRSISPFHTDDYPHRLEAGTLALPGIAGLHAGQKWFAELGREQSAGAAPLDPSHHGLCRLAMNHIFAVEMEHGARLIKAFEGMENVIIYGPRDQQPRVAALSINIDGLAADRTSALLDRDHGICVRAGLHCAPLVHEDEGTLERKGTVRFSPGFFTCEEDMDQAIKAVAEISELMSPGKSRREFTVARNSDLCEDIGS
jgi:selenocysteine lyase/cysteine desulfurase